MRDCAQEADRTAFTARSLGQGRRAAGNLPFAVTSFVGRLEAHAVFSALAPRVTRIELTREPTRAVNNITRGFAHVPVAVR
jgi:hypothetical protein